MFNNIKTFFRDRKIKKQLKTLLLLLYSKKRYERKELILSLNPKDEIEELEFHRIVDIATKLRRPFTEDHITEIYLEQLNSLKLYVDNYDLRENIIKTIKLQTDLNVMEFNFYMNRLQRAYEYNKDLPGGAIYAELISRRKPLTEKEEVAVVLEAKEILELKEQLSTYLHTPPDIN